MPLLLALAISLTAVALCPAAGVHPRLLAQTQATQPVPGFDVASIRVCRPADDSAGRGDAGTAREPSNLPEGIGGDFRASQGRLDITCGSLLSMIGIAYIQHGRPLLNSPAGPLREAEAIKGIPKWALAARYTIHAETDNPLALQPPRIGLGPESREPAADRLLFGPMLQRLLEQRFQLKLHRETEQSPMYALTVAKRGLKLKPMEEGDCIPDGPPEWPSGGKPRCYWIGWDVNGPNRRLLLGGVTLDRLAGALAELILDRNVVNRTGVPGSFVARLEYAPDENTRCVGPAELCDAASSSSVPLGAPIFTALEEQLGLKLKPIRGPKERIVIDRVEPPSEN